MNEAKLAKKAEKTMLAVVPPAIVAQPCAAVLCLLRYTMHGLRFESNNANQQTSPADQCR